MVVAAGGDFRPIYWYISFLYYVIVNPLTEDTFAKDFFEFGRGGFPRARTSR